MKTLKKPNIQRICFLIISTLIVVIAVNITPVKTLDIPAGEEKQNTTVQQETPEPVDELLEETSETTSAIIETTEVEVPTTVGTPPETEIASTDLMSEGSEWVLTAYCPCPICSCQSPDGLPHTACGAVAQANHTVAASPVYPFGTVLYIEGMGYYTVEDRFGGSVGSNRADIFFNTHEEACAFGRQVRKVTVIRDAE